MIHHLNLKKNNQGTYLLLCLFFFLSPDIQNLYALETKSVSHLFNLTKAGNSSLALPSDVTIAPDGRIYVVDGANHRIVIYRADGKFDSLLGSQGTGKGQFMSPIGIASDQKGRIYIADSGNFRIQIFNKSGKFIQQILLRENDKKIKPVDVALSPTMETIYVTGNNNHKVMLFNSQGEQTGQWGKEGNNSAEFRYPATITVGRDGAVYVVDVLNSRVQIFETDGRLRTTAGSWGVLPGQLFRPKGVALDSSGKIYVSDSYLDVIEVFDTQTKFYAVLGTNGKAQKFISPTGIFIDDNNRIYITEMLKHKVSVYQLE